MVNVRQKAQKKGRDENRRPPKYSRTQEDYPTMENGRKDKQEDYPTSDVYFCIAVMLSSCLSFSIVG